jgi:hypothetical protein
LVRQRTGKIQNAVARRAGDDTALKFAGNLGSQREPGSVIPARPAKVSLCFTGTQQETTGGFSVSATQPTLRRTVVSKILNMERSAGFCKNYSGDNLSLERSLSPKYHGEKIR